jgi:hypothetical protein
MMPALRGITTCVGYAPILAMTLAQNVKHLYECWVVTSPEDEHTQQVASSFPGVRVHLTDAFTRHGAYFNKGLALEEGFDAMSRHGWILVHDADILFPPAMPLGAIKPTNLYGCRRRILEDPHKWHPCFNWQTCQPSQDGGPIGFWQLFHADVIADKRPWYDVSFTHAGGGDAFFLGHWDAAHRTVLPFDVLHLGRTDMNWFGTDQAGRDMMARYVRENGWKGAARKHTQESAARAPEIVERVQVPGYEPSGFELPFVRRARQMRGQ